MTDKEFLEQIDKVLGDARSRFLACKEGIDYDQKRILKESNGKFYETIEELIQDAEKARKKGFDRIGGGIATDEGAKIFFAKELPYSGLLLELAAHLESIALEIKTFYSDEPTINLSAGPQAGEV